MDVGVATIILAVVTFFLVILTGFYLIETRQIRKTAVDTFLLETSPKVFLENITSIPRLNEDKKEIEVTAVIWIKNIGRTEASNFLTSYILSSSNAKIEGNIGPVPYLFPNQGVQYETKMLVFKLDDQQFTVAQEAMTTKKPLVIPASTVPPILLDLKIKYSDRQGKEQKLPYRCQYTLHNNAWVFLVD